MRELHVFESISIDGFYRTVDGDMTWAYRGNDAADFQDWTSQNARGGGDLMFGRTTYEMMQMFWPTPAAAQSMPAVAKRMNEATKYVASRTLGTLTWSNARRLEGSLVESVTELKRQDGPPITILGSGSIVAQLAAARLVDGFTFALLPIALGAGKSLFANAPCDLRLVDSRSFSNGRVALTYACA